MQKFKDYEKLLYKQAWYYAKKYRLEFGDLLSEAYLIFEEAKTLFDNTRNVSFCTFLTHRMRRLNDYSKKELNIFNRFRELPKQLAYEQPEQIVAVSILSEEGQDLIHNILNGVFDKANPIRQTQPNLTRVGKMAKECLGWNMDKTGKVWAETEKWWRAA